MNWNKIIKILKYPPLILTYMDNKHIISLKDSTYLKIFYKSKTNKKLDLDNPKTFNEKLQWLKLYDRKDEYVTMVDKYAVKKYIADTIGEQYIIPTLGVYDKFDDINFSLLPNEFVLKCTHDSGGNVICRDKSLLDINKARKKINHCLKNNYYYIGREWPYKNVKPKIIAEKYMKEDKKEELTDFKFMCFNGKVKCSFVCLDRYSKDGLKIDFYDLSWQKMPFSRHYPNSNQILPKPQNYDLMINLAERLSIGIPFVRVDFYEIKGKVYFGELTFYPGSGFEEFEPEKYDRILGDWLILPKEKSDKHEK